MKKILLAICILAAAAVNANAQVFLGGSLSIYNTNNKSSLDDSKVTANNDFSISIDPQIGFQINEKSSAGLYLSLAPGIYKTQNYVTDTKSTNTNFSWSISPFYRYTCCSFNKFNIIGEVYGSIGKSNKTTLIYGINIRPLLNYAVNEHFSLECGLNFLTLGWNGSSYKNETPLGVSKTAYGAFSFGFNRNSTISLGAIYKF